MSVKRFIGALYAQCQSEYKIQSMEYSRKRPGLANSFLFDLKDDKRLAVSEPWLLNDGLNELNTKQMP